MSLNLLNCDCMELMALTSDKAFDLAIVDPPYFRDYGKEIYPGAEISTTGVRRNRFKSDHWDVPDDRYFEELKRVSKNQIIWGINYFPNQGPGRIIWDKKNDDSNFSHAEIAYCSIHIGVRIFRHMWNGMIRDSEPNLNRIHPTQKPIALYKWLLSKYAKQGDKILDTHLGSGSIAIACHDLGFHLTGCEIDKDYYDAMTERVRVHRQQDLIKFY